MLCRRAGVDCGRSESLNQQRRASSASALVHLMVHLMLAQLPQPRSRPSRPVEAAGAAARAHRPGPHAAPARCCGRPAPPPSRPPAPVPQPRPQPTPRARRQGPDQHRRPRAESGSRRRSILRRDEDLTRNVARGRPDAPSGAASPEPRRPRRSPPAPRRTGLGRRRRRPSATLVARAPPTCRWRRRAARPALRDPACPSGPSIAGSLRNLEERMRRRRRPGPGQRDRPADGAAVLRPAGRGLHGLDQPLQERGLPELDRPAAGALGRPRPRGHRVHGRARRHDQPRCASCKSSGTPALDRAAENALLGSRLLPAARGLPARRSITMQVTFFYNESGPGS